MSDSVHKTHFEVPEMPWKKRKIPKIRYAEFRHQIEALLLAEQESFKPKKLQPAETWLDWFCKTYRERNGESL